MAGASALHKRCECPWPARCKGAPAHVLFSGKRQFTQLFHGSHKRCEVNVPPIVQRSHNFDVCTGRQRKSVGCSPCKRPICPLGGPFRQVPKCGCCIAHLEGRARLHSSARWSTPGCCGGWRRCRGTRCQKPATNRLAVTQPKKKRQALQDRLIYAAVVLSGGCAASDLDWPS